jgi:hypothetical protein
MSNGPGCARVVVADNKLLGCNEERFAATKVKSGCYYAASLHVLLLGSAINHIIRCPGIKRPSPASDNTDSPVNTSESL